MSIVTFWGSGKEQVGKTLSVVAIATNMAIEHNKRVLLISASFNNDTLKNCYWTEETKKSMTFVPKDRVELDNGIEGLAKIIQSNKIAPELITNYTKIVFKDRLEILLGFDYRAISIGKDIGDIYADIVQKSNEYYDIVLVDLDNEISQEATNKILKNSDVIVAMASQKLASVKMMQSNKNKIEPNKTLLLVGKYDKKSKYTVKNITRTIGERKEILTIPYNTLYFEAAQEGNVTDLFLRLRRIEDKNDENVFFIEQVKKATEEIIKKIESNKLIG